MKKYVAVRHSKTRWNFATALITLYFSFQCISSSHMFDDIIVSSQRSNTQTNDKLLVADRN